ncbi:TPA: 3'-5' exoribonuclease [Escherichia coli]|nr:3'-5' exoribonuclease [Escherichia coli]
MRCTNQLCASWKLMCHAPLAFASKESDMPFIGDVHNALADARHQAKYVSAIWQKIIPATSTNE